MDIVDGGLARVPLSMIAVDQKAIERLRIMATSGELAFILSIILRIPLGTVNFYGQALREAGMLSRSGRGRSAATMTAEDASTWLIALCAAESAASAAAVTKIVKKLPLDGWDFFEVQPGATIMDLPLWRRGEEPTAETVPIKIRSVGPLILSMLDACVKRGIHSNTDLSLNLGYIDFEPGGELVELALYDTEADSKGRLSLATLSYARARRRRQKLPGEPTAPTALVHIRRLELLAFHFIAEALNDMLVPPDSAREGSE